MSNRLHKVKHVLNCFNELGVSHLENGKLCDALHQNLTSSFSFSITCCGSMLLPDGICPME